MGLNKKQLEFYKKKLLELRDQTRGNINATTGEAIDEPGKGSHHQVDEGSDDFNRTVSLELSSTEQAVLRQIEHALEKMEQGTYGLCDMSGEAIPSKRLDAMPYASLSIASQEKLEKEKMN